MAEKDCEPTVDLDKVAALLHKIAIFGGLTTEQKNRLIKELRSVSYAAGERIFGEGGAPSHIYIVERGRVTIVMDIERKALVLAEFTAGHCFGETSVIGILPHAATAVAAEETDLLVLPREALLHLYDEDPRLFGMLVLNIAREACRRLYRTDAALLDYASEGASAVTNDTEP
ncbi:MAG: Crp/Fnr family transcriptional regulator [Pirellulales bacterium]